MSPRRTRAATAEQSVSTRSKGQKINNMNQDVGKSAQKIRQSQKKKSTSIKKNLEAAAKQSARKESPDVEIAFITKKTRRRLNLNEEAETDNTSVKNQNINSNESIIMLRDRDCDNITVDLVKNNLFQPASKDSEKISNEILQQKTSSSNVKLTPVTPKSTPPKLSLTPHRSKKTPKKSPISLGSPKTHSIAIPKLFKSPRKLSLVVTDENSGKNLEKSDSDSHKKSRKRSKHSSGNSSKSDKSLLISPTAKKNKEIKKEHKKSDVNLKLVRKFSKSPKIVLKSPKSKKSKSRKLKLLSPSWVRKSTPKKSTSPDTTPNLNKSSKISTKESPLSKRKSLSPIKRRLLGSKLTKTLTTSQMKDVLAEPIVLLEKLSPESMKRKNVLMVANKTRSNTLIKVRLPSISARSNSKVSINKVGSGVSTDRSSNTKLRNSMEKSQINNTNRISPRIKYNTSIQKKDNSIPLTMDKSILFVASTPQEEKITMDTSLTFNTSITSINDTPFNTRLRHKNQSNLQLSDTRDKNTNIENVSEPSLFDMEISNTSQSRLLNVTKQNATYEKVNTMEKKQKNRQKRDNTYELEQPQTLSLRKMIKKRTSTDANLSLRSNIAKKTKVRFADASSGAGSAKKSIDKLNGSRSSISHNARSSNTGNSAHKLKKVETPKFNRNSLISPFKRSSPRTRGSTPKIQLARVQITPKIFASTEKKSEKKSSTKKIPNFGKIHEQMFAKSESLVDAKNRLKARHLAFTVDKAISDVKREEKKPLPTETKDGIHNRYGFKLKKPEVTNIMLKKQTVFPRQKHQHETRMMLKGVRTNRRFELQMKARNLIL